MTRERLKRIALGAVLFLLVLFAVTLLLQAVQDAPDQEKRTVTEER